MGRAGMEITTSPWLYASVLRTFPESKKVESMQLLAAGKRILTVGIIYAPSSSSDHITLSCRSLWVGPRKGYQPGCLFREFHEGNDRETWRGIIRSYGLPDLK